MKNKRFHPPATSGTGTKNRSLRIQGRRLFDGLSGTLFKIMTVFSGLIVFAMGIGLYLRSRPILMQKSLGHLLFTCSWHPLRGEFGFCPFIVGTLWVTGIAVFIAVPLCLLTALYLSEYAPSRIRNFASPLIDLLAGIPSVIFGIWGVLVIIPLIKDYLAPWFGAFSTGYSALAGGLVLAIMIFPVIIHVMIEVFRTIPHEVREASWALGATQWQTVKHVVLRKGLPGVIAAIVLGLSRAFGETMAVLMVAGNVTRLPHSVFDPAYPLPALLANHYGEMMSVPLYDSALLFSSLILLVVVLIFNILSRLILVRVVRRTR